MACRFAASTINMETPNDNNPITSSPGTPPSRPVPGLPIPAVARAPLPEEYVAATSTGQGNAVTGAGGVNNTNSNIEIAANGMRVKLPMVFLLQAVSMLGAFGGMHALNKSDTQQQQNDVKITMDRVQRVEVAQVELATKLARIEENTKDCREAIRELRQWLRVRAGRDQ